MCDAGSEQSCAKLGMRGHTLPLSVPPLPQLQLGRGKGDPPAQEHAACQRFPVFRCLADLAESSVE